MKRISIFALLLILLTPLFAQIKVISPVEGVWANKQMLILDSDSKGECFYSLNGSDPETFGFAYDGPVLLDIEGEVLLKITRILPDKTYEKLEILYTVKQDKAYNSHYYSFLSDFIDSGIIYYNAGSVLSIPEELLYCFNGAENSFVKGTDILIDENNILNRYIPVTFFDPLKNIKYHFTIKTHSQNAGIFSRRDVPFIIEDWTNIKFTDENLLFKIDSEFWCLPKEDRYLDRSVSHMIYWQSINFEQGNPVEFFVLPPKPQIVRNQTNTGAIIYSVDAPEEDEYTISVKNKENDYQELYTQIGIDTFEGDTIDGQLVLDIFSNSVYQGSELISYNINKAPVTIPTITSTADAFYSLSKVSVLINTESHNDLYVAVSDAIPITSESKELSPSDSRFNVDLENRFKKVDGSSFEISFESSGESAEFYKIQAYASSLEKNSLVAEYSVIVDNYNLYFDSNANPETQNGTLQSPFTSFEKCLAAINSNRSVCVHVNGDLVIPSGKNILTSNCDVKTSSNSSIVFEPGANLVVQNASLQFNNARIQNSSSENFNNIIPLIKLENSVLSLFDSVIAAEFSKNGVVIDSSYSVINIKNCIASVTSASYGSFISCSKSKVNVELSTVNVFSDTCVIISDNNSETNIYKNIMKIGGRTGRICEFFGSNATVSNNEFKAQFTNAVSISPIYKNKNAAVKENKNEYIGF